MSRTTMRQAQERHDHATPDDDGEDYATCDECGEPVCEHCEGETCPA